MCKLIESAHVSPDGVTGAPERSASGAFVTGRVTYEQFLANWDQAVGDPCIDRIIAMSAQAMPFSGQERPRPMAVWAAADLLAFPVGPVLSGWLLSR